MSDARTKNKVLLCLHFFIFSPGGSSSSAAPSNESLNGRNQSSARSENASGSAAPPQMLGGLFANGMPTLKRTGMRAYEKGQKVVIHFKRCCLLER